MSGIYVKNRTAYRAALGIDVTVGQDLPYTETKGPDVAFMKLVHRNWLAFLISNFWCAIPEKETVSNFEISQIA